jgi:hypothetical protein
MRLRAVYYFFVAQLRFTARSGRIHPVGPALPAKQEISRCELY